MEEWFHCIQIGNKWMSVQVAACTVDQLFSKHLIENTSGEGSEIVCSEGQPITGMLSIPEYQRPYCWQSQ